MRAATVLKRMRYIDLTGARTCAICSFPKSGNTWIRHILATLYGLEDVKTQVPDVYLTRRHGRRVETAKGPVRFFKSHAKSHDFLERKARKSVHQVICVKRHPLDVYCSLLNFLSDRVSGHWPRHLIIPIPSVEAVMARGQNEIFFNAFTLYGTLMPDIEDIGGWFDNVSYWTAAAERDDAVVMLEYEGLVRDPVAELIKLRPMLGVTESQLESALSGAAEKTRTDGRFFWKKEVGNYRNFLSDDQIARFYDIHGERLADLGYGQDTSAG